MTARPTRWRGVVRTTIRALVCGLALFAAGWGINLIHAAEARMHEHIGEEREKRRSLQLAHRYQRDLEALRETNRQLTLTLRHRGRLNHTRQYATR